MSRVAKLIGAVAFLLTEIAALFGSWIVASIRCCGAGAAGPQTTQDWVAIAVFAVIMVVPAALVGAGAAVVTEGVLMLADTVRTAVSGRHARRRR